MHTKKTSELKEESIYQKYSQLPMPLLSEDSYFSIRNAGKQNVSRLIKCCTWFMTEVTFNYFGGFLANFEVGSVYNLKLQLVLMEPSF